jgi:hypothetical protein
MTVILHTMRSPLFARLLLIFALLFAQMGSLAHGISHILAKKSQDSEQSLPHDKYCDQCVAYAQIGSAIGSNGISISGSENFETLHFNEPDSCTSNTFVAFAARAPPYSA